MTPSFVRDIYHLASDWHSGQWSRGYRLLCRVYQYAQRHGIPLYPYRRSRRYQRLRMRYHRSL